MANKPIIASFTSTGNGNTFNKVFQPGGVLFETPDAKKGGFNLGADTATPEDLTTAAQFRATGSLVDTADTGLDLSSLLNTMNLPNVSSDLPENLNKLVDGANDAINSHQSRISSYLEQNKFAVRLKAVGNGKVVAFRTSPEINETRNNAYRTIDPVHLPGAVQVFTNSSPRSWNLASIKLISRNGVEAEENLETINILRSWMLPFFGNSTTTDRDGYGNLEMLGSPPEILMFTAYSDHGEDARGRTNIRNIPVIMNSLNIPYSSDVDYIKTAKTNQPFPAIMSVDINVIEAHSPREYNTFDIIAFREGKLPGF